MQALPIGIQTFSSIREADYVYIDKTELIWQMAQRQGRYFLSRPRRFGKSLLVDTLKELYEGNGALFKGLYIENKWDWSTHYPVIKLDFSGGDMRTAEQLQQNLEQVLQLNKNRLGIQCDDLQGSNALRKLIIHCYQQCQQKVVVLVDEYDKPILDNIDQPDVAAYARESLKSLYSLFKELDQYIQFVFMTGVSKFSKVSLFSGLNQLEDITLDPNYATICGYTQHDLETSFAQHLQGVDWAELRQWYNGYNFWGESVYNPYDILLFISKNKSYQNYWFETGSPSFLLKLFRQKQYFLPNLEQIEVSADILNSFELDDIDPLTLLFQAGYLTIDQVERDELGELNFRLKIPNREVKVALYHQLLATYSQQNQPLRSYRKNLLHALKTQDLNAVENEITRLFAAVPWRNFTNNDLDTSEGYYASVLYAWLASLNAEIIPEDINNRGQVDLTVKLADNVFVIEIKLDQQQQFQPQQPNPALQQIITRGYADKYRGQPVVLIGLVFNASARNLVQMDWKQVEQ